MRVLAAVRAMTKRHAKPTAQQLSNRTYRKVVAIERAIAILRSGQAMLSERTESCARLLEMILYDSKEAREDNLATLPAVRRAIDRESQGAAHLRVTARTLVDHCQRLLKEKETLRAMIYPTDEEMQRRQVNTYMAAPVRPCAVSHLHRPNIRCGLCGHIDLDIPTLEDSIESTAAKYRPRDRSL